MCSGALRSAHNATQAVSTCQWHVVSALHLPCLACALNGMVVHLISQAMANARNYSHWERFSNTLEPQSAHYTTLIFISSLSESARDQKKSFVLVQVAVLADMLEAFLHGSCHSSAERVCVIMPVIALRCSFNCRSDESMRVARKWRWLCICLHIRKRRQRAQS